MTPEAADTLRRAAAHVLVNDVDLPIVDDHQSHHIFRVLRTAAGETVTVTDGAGRWRICTAGSGTIEPSGEVRFDDRNGPVVTIGFTIPKQDRPEWIVQKLTEVGVGRIVLLQSERSVVMWDHQRASKHVAKLERVAAEALQQSRGVWLPVIDGPVPALEFLPSAVAAEPGGRAIGPSDHTIAIGPEGGWSADELAVSAGSVSIGQNVLRTETAALAAAVGAIAATE